MEFFVPHAESREEAERVLQSTAEFVGGTVPKKRIYRLHYTHNREPMVAEIGKPADSYYREGDQPAIAILPAGGAYAVCLPYRGVIRGGPILVGSDSVTKIETFDS